MGGKLGAPQLGRNLGALQLRGRLGAQPRFASSCGGALQPELQLE